MREPWWDWGMWFYRAVFTQTNGAGGAMVVDFAPVAGMTMIVMSVVGENSGTNSLRIERTDEDNIDRPWFADISSGAGTFASIPQTLSFAGTSSVMVDTTSAEVRTFRENDRLTILQLGAGAQNDTLTISLRAFLSSAERPVVVKGRSTNPGDVTIGTPTVDDIR